MILFREEASFQQLRRVHDFLRGLQRGQGEARFLPLVKDVLRGALLEPLARQAVDLFCIVPPAPLA